MKRYLILILGLTLSAPAVLIQTGCTTSQQTVAYKTLTSVGQSVDAAMIVAAQLKTQGKISDVQWAQISAAHDKFNLAYNEAVVIAGANYSAPASDNVLLISTQLLALIAQFQS